MRRKCRIWWPKSSPLSNEPFSRHFLFGWFVSASGFCSIDVVVAFACNAELFRHCGSSLEEILCDTSKSIPVILQEKSKFTRLGHCTKSGEMSKVEMEEAN